ncbi:MAG: 3-keto-5-aminohexanoate cleavage protein, partial [Woeseiaceae bacterium]|nr:3-keto-5-aminohexanoate cleavage protein [Woeseiaceae bacterium]
MSEPCIITVAITGSVARKSDNPAVPESVAEQIESTHEAFEAGAALVHYHSRHDDGSPGTVPEKFAEFQEAIRKHCPGIIVQFSTGGRSGTGAERGSMLHFEPDMASLATGSCNFPVSVYANSNELIEELASAMLEHNIKPEIEVFDLAMLFRAADMAARGLLKSPLHVQFVLGVKNALPAHRDILEFELDKLRELLPDATWVAAGIGRAQYDVNRWCLELGGHMRTGLEDNVRLDENTLAPSNAALVSRAAELCDEYGRHPASTAEARAILGLEERS